MDDEYTEDYADGLDEMREELMGDKAALPLKFFDIQSGQADIPTLNVTRGWCPDKRFNFGSVKQQGFIEIADLLSAQEKAKLLSADRVEIAGMKCNVLDKESPLLAPLVWLVYYEEVREGAK